MKKLLLLSILTVSAGLSALNWNPLAGQSQACIQNAQLAAKYYGAANGGPFEVGLAAQQRRAKAQTNFAKYDAQARAACVPVSAYTNYLGSIPLAQ